MRRTALLATTLAGALALPAAAQAHVTLQPDTAPAGKFARLDVRVPTEGGDATRKVVLDLPPGFVFASYEPAPGWTVRMTTRKLTHPVATPDGTVEQEVRRISWTARSGATIPPGAFQDFGLAVRVPDGKPGEKLTFGATQVYASGATVSWTGAADAETPAPQVTLAGDEVAATGAATPAPEEQEAVPTRQLALGGLAAGALGIVFGLAGLRRRRRLA